MPRLPGVVIDLVRYGLVSAAALSCDYGLLISLVHGGVQYLVAGTISFTIGIFVAYGLSARFVFPDRRALSSEAEAAGFFAVGIVGLILTQILMFVFVAKLQLAVPVAKVPTTAIVFVFNFVCRRSLVFGGRRRPPIRPTADAGLA